MNLTLALQRLSIYWESLTLVEEAPAINSCRSPENRGSSCFITTPLWWERRMPQTFRIADNVSVRCFLNPQQPTHLPRSVCGCTLRPKKCLSSNTIPVAGDRGERKWLLDIWEREREREWLSPFPNFGNGNGNDKFHSQLLGTGTGMKISFPIFGNGNGNGNSIPEFWEREWDVVIPGNDRERERE